MNMSENLNELFTALAKAQGEMAFAGETSNNPFFKSKYADFAELIKASRPALVKHGLSVTQRVVEGEDGMSLSSILGHSSGQWMESRMKINPPKSDIQSMGSYMTYLKRYSYAALVGVATDDDDGEAAMNGMRNGRNPHGTQAVELITPEQHEQLQEELKNDPELAEEILRRMNLSALKQMPKDKFLSSIKRIREITALKKQKA